MSIDIGQASPALAVAAICAGIVVALLGGPLRDAGWRKRIEAELRIAQAMAEVAGTEEQKARAAAFIDSVTRRAVDFSESADMAHAAKGFPHLFPMAIAMPAAMTVVFACATAWGNASIDDLPPALVIACISGAVLDVTTPAFKRRMARLARRVPRE